MGFEIKNICTVVPNPHRPRKDNDYFYFSLFITPRLQFDGTLKEYYEMLHWPEYAWNIFLPHDKTKTLHCVNVKSSLADNITPILYHDNYYLTELAKQMGIQKELEEFPQHRFLKKSQMIWKKLFPPDMPVESWPIYLKPQITAFKQEYPIKPEKDENLTRSAATSNTATISYDSVAKKETKEIRNIKDEKYELTKYRQEFHKKISALSRYPHILRVLGLIQDFKIHKADLCAYLLTGKNKPAAFYMQIVVYPQNIDTKQQNSKKFPIDEFLKSVQFVRPFTKCAIIDNNDCEVDAIDNQNLDEEKLKEYRLRACYLDTTNFKYSDYVTDGFLRTGDDVSPVFIVDQEYYEDQSSVPQDTKEINDSSVIGINTKTFSEEDVKIIKQKNAEKQKIAKGFSIKIHGQPTDLLVSMDKHFDTITDDNIEDEKSAFMAHHLDCGYRIDVSTDEGKSFKSLCERQARYDIDNFLRKQKLFTRLWDEPWLEEVRQIDVDGKASRFEEVARWNGWSLTCPPLKENKSAPNKDADDIELTEIRPPEGSLPKLRFDQKYWFRIRTVDVCGNGPLVEDAISDAGVVLYRTPIDDNGGKAYDCPDPLHAPLFFSPYPLVFDLDKADDMGLEKKKKDGYNINSRYRGEDNETLVIRTKIDTSNNVSTIDNQCVRYLTPPYIPMHWAEMSGLLNINYKNKIELSRLYKLLSTVPKPFYEKHEIEGNAIIPFLTDPRIYGVGIAHNGKSFIKKNLPEDAPKILQVFTRSKDELNKHAIKLVLKENERQLVCYSTMQISVYLKRGESKIFTITSVGKDNIRSSPKEFLAIHAIQRPFLDGCDLKKLTYYLQFEKIHPDHTTYNTEQKYQARIKKINDGTRFFPFSTAGELTLHAEYYEYVLNPKNPKGWSFVSREFPVVNKDGTPQKGINSDDIDQFGNVDKYHITRSWSNLDESAAGDKYGTLITDDVCTKAFCVDEVLESAKKVKDNFNYFQHSFPDAKFRKVKYHLEGVSKFAAFFDPDKHHIGKDDTKPFSVFASLDKEEQGGEGYYQLKDSKGLDCFYTIIANSAKPSKPNVTAVIPILTTEEPKKNDKFTYKFEHKTFRIYLGSTWYETGLGEKIAVIWKKDNAVEEEHKNKVSIVANDPTTDPKYGSYERYNDGTKVHYPLGSKLPEFDLEINTHTLEESNSWENNDSNQKLKADDYTYFAFEVEWDIERKEFFAEISININKINHYSSLLQFAICRYQEHSIKQDGCYDYRFSEVVMTDMVSLLPSRYIYINGDSIRVEGVAGQRYGINKGKPSLKPNKFYIIQDVKKPAAEDGVVDIQNPGESKIYIGLSLNNQLYKNDLKEINNGSPLAILKNCVIEEYEDISLHDDFYMAENKDYNPRNDPTKRLVFFYKIE